MSTVNCVVTPAMIMKKLHILKSQYRREVKEMKTSQKSGVGTDDLYLPRLSCYDALVLLGDVVTPLCIQLIYPTLHELYLNT